MDEDFATYEVVSYDDARALARDAAESAAALVSVRSDADIESVAEAAADAAASAAVDGVVGEVSERLDEVASRAAGDAVKGVQDSLDAQTLALRDAQEALESATVTLDADQYDVMVYQMRVQLGASFVSMLLCAACLGSLVWISISREVGR